MQIAQQILFIGFLAVAVWLFSKKVGEIRRNILLGKEENLTDNKNLRWKNLLLLAFGQKKMFKNPLVALMHFVIYAGFIIINIEVLEILLDGILGKHRLFADPLGGFYTFVLNFFEILAVGVLAVCIVFLVRRNIIKLKRFISHDLDGWPRTDANGILITEIVLMSLFLLLNASDRALQLNGQQHYHDTGNFIISGWVAPYLQSINNNSLAGIERASWWLHIAGILAFLNYLPYSKHLHILLAFPNAYYARLEPFGKMKNMPEIQNEVLYAMQPELAPTYATPPAKFGAKDVMDLSWKSLLDAYSCTECGRCSAACPANQTGKLLSP
ncbi:MAG: (Fe-S)-binding protein, partial [Sphingobacteriales bacterium]|nr:(Fe-S)-binding protein [Sphingobacteriales bacterium]